MLRGRRLAGFPAADVALALLLCLLAVLSVATGNPDEGPVYLTLPVAVVTTLAVAWRLRAPMVAVVLIVVAGVTQSALSEPLGSLWALAAYAIVMYSVAAHYPEGKAAIWGIAMLAALLLEERLGNGVDYLFMVLLFGGVWLLGRASRLWRARVTHAEQHQRDTALLAVAEERVRIARELHDIVAHSLSVIAVQADAADAALDRDPGLAREPVRAIRSSARDSLAEIRRMLQLLRTEGDSQAPVAGLSAIDDLIANARSAGLPVEAALDRGLLAHELSPVVDQAAYRIVQEALTNVIKHAGLVPTRVVLRQATGHVELEIVNAPGQTAGPDAGGSGFGLIGIRERVAAVGGTLSATVQPDGGFRLAARLPVKGVTE